MQDIDNTEFMQMEQEIKDKYGAGITLIGGGIFPCHTGHASGSKGVYFWLKNINARVSEISITYASGDTTNYTLLYQINGGNTESYTFTPTDKIKILTGDITSVTCWLMIPANAGNPQSSCKIVVHD